MRLVVQVVRFPEEEPIESYRTHMEMAKRRSGGK
ncbi:Uncharacterised protein [uncultured archaeon]|nr:Uncharacterised protein [uncultured archaeon]